MKILRKTYLKAKISMKFDPRVTWANLIGSRGDVCLHKIIQVSRFIYENTKKNSQKASLNEKFIQLSLCIGLRSKRL